MVVVVDRYVIPMQLALLVQLSQNNSANSVIDSCV